MRKRGQTQTSEDEEQRYAALIQNLTVYAQKEPRRYRFRVGALAVLGYAYLFVILAILIALLGLIGRLLVSGGLNGLTIRLGIFLLVFVWIVVRALWVTIPRPEGIPLTPASVPELFAMLTKTTQSMAAPTFHHVLLTDDYNAGVQQVPRFGIFGVSVNYLLLGLPLMAALPPDQFQAVVAHEVGHLSGNHGRFSGWIYRVRQTWMTLMGELGQRRHRGAWLFAPFFRWYAPFFSAYSFVLARSDEYVADRCAAAAAGREAAAAALVSVQVRGHFLEEDFWPSLVKQARDLPEPPAEPFGLMLRAFRQTSLAEAAPKWIRRAFHERTDLLDTHPALPDRLAALGYRPAGESGLTDPPLPSPALPLEETAAQRFLGSSLERLTREMEALWRAQVAPLWAQQHKEAEEAAQRLQELDARVQRGDALTLDEQFKRAEATAEIVGGAPAIPLYASIAADHPDNAQARYILGHLRLQEEDAQGIADLEAAMSLDRDCTLPASGAIYTFLKSAGRHDEAEPYRKRALARNDVEELAEAERSALSPRDKFLPSELPDEVIAHVREQLSSDHEVKAGYVVRKAVEHLPDHPFYVIAVEPRIPPFKLRAEDAAQKLIRRLWERLEMPSRFAVVSLEGNFAAMRGRLRKVPGALIFRR